MMSGRGKFKKAKIDIEKPELPAFLQRMKEEIVAYEDNERRERCDNRRRARPVEPGDPDDDPTIVKLDNDDLTEAEYKRMKSEMESHYKIDDTNKPNESKTHKSQELDIDLIMNSRQLGLVGKIQQPECSTSKSKSQSITHREAGESKNIKNKKVHGSRKVLSYGSSSDDDEDD